jgi:hypothetical protein
MGPRRRRPPGWRRGVGDRQKPHGAAALEKRRGEKRGERERAAWERQEQGEAPATRGGGLLREDRAGAAAGEMGQVGRLG